MGFVYPEEWENVGVTDRGPITTLRLRKREPPIEVTLYWTRPDMPTSPTSVGDIEYEGLRSVCGNNVGKPKAVRSGDQPGYRLAMADDRADAGSTGQSGVIYVFAVLRDGQPWKIKLRATARRQEHLSKAEDLLQNYRW